MIAQLSDPGTAKSLDTTVVNLEAISQQLLTVSKDAQKIVQGISTIFESQ